MTVVAALIDDKGTIWLGADSAGVCAGSLAIENRLDTKVFYVKKFMIGFTSSFRMGQLLKWKFAPPKHPKGMSNEQYMHSYFIDRVRMCFRAGGYEEQVNGVESGGTFLVGYRGEIFNIGNDFQIGQSRNRFQAVGCGEAYALGSLMTTDNLKMEPLDKLTLALCAAQQGSAGVREPFVVINSKNKVFEFETKKVEAK